MEETAVLEAKATLKYARISARKVKIVADLIRGKNVDEALAIVKFTPKASSEVIEKLLKSAIANAENNHGMKHEKLYVAEIFANQGPTLKRIRPAAKGSAADWSIGPVLFFRMIASRTYCSSSLPFVLTEDSLRPQGG